MESNFLACFFVEIISNDAVFDGFLTSHQMSQAVNAFLQKQPEASNQCNPNLIVEIAEGQKGVFVCAH